MIKNVAFIYLTPESGKYYPTDDLSFSVQKRPQLGIQYLCAVLERKGIKTDIFDQTVFSFDLYRLIKKLKEYNMAGFYCSDSHEDKVKSFCKKIKEALDIPILVGGPSTFTNSTFLDHGCDIVVHGEGEITIEEIIEYYNGERERGEIKGISFKKNGSIIKTPQQELIKNLDELPFPDRSKIDVNLYYDYFLFGMRRPYITMIASRGCVYKCAFCTSWKIWGCRYRRRSVDNVLLEIDDAVKRYNVRYVAFQDDILGMTNAWFEEFSKKLIERPYKIRWYAILHPFSVRVDTEKILRLMKKAGCDLLSFGLQSAHPEILKNINRDPSEPQQLKKIIKIANRLGFVTGVAYIFGLPGDTRETVQTTIDYSLSCGSTVVNFYSLSVLKGSEIERLYNGKKICDLIPEEAQMLAVSASKKFYTRPGTILKMAYFMVKNPEWLIKSTVNIFSILARLGFVKVRKRYDIDKKTEVFLE